MGWSPILAGADEERAWRALELLTEALREPGAAGDDVSLARGEAGVALFFGYIACVTGRSDLAQLAQDRLGVAIDRVIADPPHPFLFGGITGVAWVAEHLAAMGPDPGGEDPHEEIDRMIQADVLAAEKQELGKLDELESEIAKELGATKQKD